MINFKISSGLPGLDNVIDYFRPGDNVVWQVDSIDDYKYFVDPFVSGALNAGEKVVYFRFGQHPELIPPGQDIKVFYPDAHAGFESFSAQVHTIASTEGKAFYVFDCLSDLQSVWATDLMVGNFFKVTCPYLFKLGALAYFTLLRNTNSYQTVARIRDTTQLLVDVYHYGNDYYVQPLKAWNRYSPTMFLPHVETDGKFIPITSSAETSRLFSHFQRYEPGDTEKKLDYWDRVLLKAQEVVEKLENGEFVPPNEELMMRDHLCRMMIGKEERILELAKRYFSVRDLVEIRNRLIGSGYIGGKTVGMLLARKILETDTREKWEHWLEPHDSFYVGSDVYYTYLVENDCWELRLQQKDDEHYFSAAPELKQRIVNGSFPPAIREDFFHILEYFGQSPIIVRSSSLLEDSFGNAFAGKYESIFCVNQGTPQERYELFEQAVRTIYASTMNKDALTYRLKRGLAKSDEQMALLIQRVSGTRNSTYFYPDLAGVALSQNPYVWREDMDASAGMIRLVMGLGTRAVDRVEDDYPRIVALDKPSLRPDSNPAESRRFSQHRVDVLDTHTNSWSTVPLQSVSQPPARPACWNLVARYDSEAAAQRRRSLSGEPQREEWIITFDTLLTSTPFAQTMKNMLKRLQAVYRHPVDTEFTTNFLADGQMQINLLQCRPLQIAAPAGINPARSHIDQKQILFRIRHSFMGSSLLQPLQRIIYINDEAYHDLPIQHQYQTARILGKLNHLISDRESTPTMLIGPGRWGSSIPSLGIPVSFAQICNMTALVETDNIEAGYMPELSFGTHFFQDLVETSIFYAAIFTGKSDVSFSPELLRSAPNLFYRLLPDYPEWGEVIKVIEPSAINYSLWLRADLSPREAVCYFEPILP